MKRGRALTPTMRGMAGDFNRKPVKARGETADAAGLVVKPAERCTHYDGRTFSALTSRGILDYLKRCACEGPCSCGGNGYHLTDAGRKALEA